MTVDEKSEAASTAIEATSDQEPINSPEYGSSPTIADFHRLLNYRRRVADGELPEPNGHYTGDGIPRDFSGRPYEPLSWGHVLIFGRR